MSSAPPITAPTLVSCRVEFGFASAGIERSGSPYLQIALPVLAGARHESLMDDAQDAGASEGLPASGTAVDWRDLQ